MKRFFNSKAKIAVAAVGGIAVLSGGIGAFAYWTSTGSGTGSASTGTNTAFTVASSPATGSPLTPDGPTQTVAYTVTNPSSGAQQLTAVAIKVANSDGSPWTSVPGCSASDYKVGGAAAGATFNDTAGLPATIASTGVRNGSVSVQMIDTGSPQDGCKNATVPLYFSAS